MDLMRIIAEEHGFFTRQEAKEAGYADRDITRMVRARTWVRIRRGAYVFADTWSQLDDVGRHRVRSSAVLRSLGPNVALSHVSGCVRHEINVWGLPLGRIHVTRLDGGPGRIEGDVVHHEGFCLDDDVEMVNDERVLRPSRCALETSSRATNEVALCVLDSGLRLGSFDVNELHRSYGVMQHWPYMRHVQIPVGMADGRSGSIGETRGRWLFRVQGLPAPDLQYAVRRPDGSVAGYCDWGWPEHGLLGEFDGLVKYGRLVQKGQTSADVVIAEKRREDELRELTGFGMVRLMWDDYEQPTYTASRIERLMKRAG